MPATEPLKRYHNAVFLPNGELVGTRTVEIGDLSDKWLEICASFIAHKGPAFRASWGQQLSHIETRLTAAGGAAMGTFWAHGEIVVSELYLAGRNPAAESEAAELFIGSLEKSDFAKSDRVAGPSAFDQLRDSLERPLTATVVWGNPKVSEQDNQLIFELTRHFAAALHADFLSGAV